MRLHRWIVLFTLLSWACDDSVTEPEAGEMAGETMAGEAMAGEAMAGEAIAGEAMAGEAMAGEAMAGEAMAGETMAGETMAGEAMAGETMAGEVMAGETMAGETVVAQCADGEDNDGDGAVDLNDPGCADAEDDDESDDPPVTCYEQEPINLNEALATADFYEADLSTFGESSTQGICGGNAGPEAIFTYEVTQPLTRLIFTTEFAETTKPVVLYVREECEGSADEVGENLVCNRGGPDNPGTSVELSEVMPTTYYVFVDTGSMAEGPGVFRLAVETEGAPQCRDEEDNDGDGLIDLADPGCVEPNDLDETDPDPLPECGDGIDNDGDQLTDYPNDPQCSAAGENREAQLCQNDYASIFELEGNGGSILVPFEEDETVSFTDGCRANSGPEALVVLTLEEPSNVTVDFEDGSLPFSVYLRSSCDDVTSQVACVNDMTRSLRATDLEPGEYFLFIDAHDADVAPTQDLFPFLDITITSLITECNDGLDNDMDNAIDQDDIGCSNSADTSETDPAVAPVCSDGIDNDADGFTDYPDDQDCVAAGARYETPACLNIDAAAVIGLDGGVVSLDTSLGQNNYAGECGSGTSEAPEQMVELDLSQPASVTIEVQNGETGFDSIIYVRSDCETVETSSFCDDTGIQSEELSFIRLEKGRYFVFVDGYFSDDSGEIDLLFTVNPLPQAQCEDDEDNDEDGLVDINDPGCSSFFDNDEVDGDVDPACADGIDNDMDGSTDYPEDLGCFARGSDTEAPICAYPTPLYQLGQAGGSVDHTFSDGGNFFASSCSAGEGVEMVIELTLDELSDINIQVTTGDDFDVPADSVISIWDSCQADASETGCASSDSGQASLLEAGTYYLVIERDSGVVLPEAPWRVAVDVTSRIGQCNDEEDNDLDTLIDLFDSGCTGPFDQSEADPDEVPECFDTIDNDGDGQTDYPEDTDCVAAGDNVEQRRCQELEAIEVGRAGIEYLFDPATAVHTTRSSCGNVSTPEVVFAVTIDEPSSIILDARDPSGDFASIYTSIRRRCDDLNSEVQCISSFPRGPKLFDRLQPGVYFLFVERSSSFNFDLVSINLNVVPDVRQCSDGVDNDGDSLIDLNDPGCLAGSDNDETSPEVSPACSDMVDNDEDGTTDYPEDTFCLSAGQSSEAPLCEAYNGADGSAPDADMIVVTETGTFDLDTSDASASNGYTNGSSAASPEIPVAIVLTEASQVSIETTQSDFDTYLHMRVGECDNPDLQIAFNDDGTGLTNFQSLIEFSQLDAGVYYVFVDGYSGFGSTESGQTTLSVTINAVPEQPAVACDDGEDNDGDGFTDLNDPGCVSPSDNDETTPEVAPVCSLGTDDDGDGFNGYPDDPDCLGAGDVTDETYCASIPSVFTELVDGKATLTIEPSIVGEYITTGTCGAALGQPEAVVFDVAELSDVFVTLDAEGSDTESSDGIRVVSLRSDCDDEFSELACVREVTGDSQELIAEMIPAGRYTLLVEHRTAESAGPITLDLEVVSRVTECNDGEDNNGNGLIDLFDQGCVDGDSPSETLAPGAPVPACSDTIDNDEDGAIDYPNDPDCTGAGATVEVTLCETYEPILVSGSGLSYRYEPTGEEQIVNSCGFSSSGEAVFAIDVTETSTIGVTVLSDAGNFVDVYRELRSDCDDPDTEIECLGIFGDDIMTVTNVEPGWYFLSVHGSSLNINPFNVNIFIIPEGEVSYACNDEEDNDGDGFVDLSDPGCTAASDNDEADPESDPECYDTIDNDGDGLTDYPADLDCLSAGDHTESVRCESLPSVDVELAPTGESVTVNVSPDQAGEGADVGSCENAAGLGDAAVISFEVTELSDLYTSFGGRNLDRIAYLRTACEDDPDSDDDELSCRTQEASRERTDRLLTPGRYYLHIKRISVLDIEPIEVSLRLVSRVTECNDGVDNDLDGATDLFDSGCSNGDDQTELTEVDEPLPACADFEDNDGDGLTDYPEDTDCIAAGSDYETPACLNIEPSGYVTIEGGTFTVDTSDGEHNYAGTCGSSFTPSTAPEKMLQLEVDVPVSLVVTTANASLGFDPMVYLRSDCENLEPDSYCDDVFGDGERLEINRLEPGRYFVFIDGYASNDFGEVDVTFEVTSLITECNDGEDNDLDGAVDADDVGCTGELDTTEATDSEPEFEVPECSDTLDNDGDGLIDYPLDPECEAAGTASELPICNTYSFTSVGPEGGEFSFAPSEEYVGRGVGCSPSSGEEAVYRIEVSELSRLTVSVTDDDGDASSVYMALRTDCDDVVSETLCYSTFPSGPKVFDNVEAGYYFLVVHRSEFAIENPFNVNITAESLIVECNDGEDNDMDGAVDSDDLGCSATNDDSEGTDAEPDFEAPECGDGIDNDMDGETDYPNDSVCATAGSENEAPFCNLYDRALRVISESTAESLVFDTTGLANNYTRNTSATGPEIPFAIELAEESDVTITFSSDIDSYVHVRQGLCDGVNTYDYDDDSAGNRDPLLEMTGVPAGLYYVFVDGFGSTHEGIINVDVVITPAAN